MNEIRLLAWFETEPSTQDKVIVRDEIQRFIKTFAPDIELNEESGEGSWWISIGGALVVAGFWLVLQIGSWAVKKGLDYLAKKSLPAKEDSTSRAPSNDISGGDDMPSHSSLKFELLAHYGAQMYELANRIDATRLTFGEWSGAGNRGRLISLDRTEESITLTVIETDSKADFDSRLGSRL